MLSVRKSLLPLLVFLAQLSNTTAIGGWQTVFTALNQWNKDRSQNNVKSKKTDSSQIVIPTVSRRGRKEADDAVFDEVLLTSKKMRSTRSVRSAPSFVKGRRICLDGDDLASISLVGWSPFL